MENRFAFYKNDRSTDRNYFWLVLLFACVLDIWSHTNWSFKKHYYVSLYTNSKITDLTSVSVNITVK